MGFLGGFWRGKEKAPNEIKLDKKDIEANEVARQVETSAKQINELAFFLRGRIDEVITKSSGDPFFAQMAFEDFINGIEERSNEPEFLELRRRIEQFALLSGINLASLSSLKEFLEILNEELVKSEHILHPGGQEHSSEEI